MRIERQATNVLSRALTRTGKQTEVSCFNKIEMPFVF